MLPTAATAGTPDARDEGGGEDGGRSGGRGRGNFHTPEARGRSDRCFDCNLPGHVRGELECQGRARDPSHLGKGMQIAIKRYIRRQQGTALAASGKREEEDWQERQDELQEFDRHGRAVSFALSATATHGSPPAQDRVGFILAATTPSTDARAQAFQEPAGWSPPAEEYAGFILAATASPFALNTEDARAPLAPETVFVDTCSTHHVWTARADVTDVRELPSPVNIQGVGGCITATESGTVSLNVTAGGVRRTLTASDVLLCDDLPQQVQLLSFTKLAE